MSAEIRKSTVALSRTVHKGKGQTVCQADVIVPDSMPDCLKVLQIEGKAIRESTVISKGKASVRGRVNCNILYVPENAKGVRTVEHAIPFTYTENVPEAEEGMFLHCECEVTHIEFQLVNSRKISIKAIVEPKMEITGSREMSFVSSVEGDEAELKSEKFCGNKCVVCKEAEFDITENIPLPKNTEEVIKSHAEIKGRDVKIINNKVVAKGELAVCLLFKGNEESLDTIKMNVAFTEILDAEGINEAQHARIKYRVQSVSTKLREVEGGKEAQCVIGMHISICSEEKVEFEAVTDIYGTGAQLVPAKEKVKILNQGKDRVTKIDLREIVTPEEDAPGIVKIFALQVVPTIGECVITPAGVKIDGEAVCSITYISDKEDAMVHTSLFNLPFSTISEKEEGTDSYSAHAECYGGEYTLSGNNVELRLPIDIIVTGQEVKETEIVNEVTLVEEDMVQRPTMVLYYVQKGDSIWEVAKRYHSKISDIERINKIDGDELREGMMLLIPKR